MENSCYNSAVTTHCVSGTFPPTQRCAQVDLVQKLFGSTVTHSFLHSFSWLFPFSVRWSYQKGCRNAKQSPPAGLQLASGKFGGTYTNMQARRSYLIKWEVLADKAVRKTSADCVSSMFWELQECTEDAEVEWRLFKAAITSSVARVCRQKQHGEANVAKNQPLGGAKWWSWTMQKTSAHVLSTSRNHDTGFLVDSFGECCGCTVLTIPRYRPSCHCILLRNLCPVSGVKLQSYGKSVCFHTSRSKSIG